MLSFYKTAAITFLCLFISTGVLLDVGGKKAELSTPMLPKNHDKAVPWTKRLVPEVPFNPSYKTLGNEDTHLLDWDFILPPDEPFPYASYSLDFADINQPSNLLDWTRYDGVSFRVRCSPRNTMVFILFTMDEKVTVPTEHSSYRPSSAVFPCEETWSTIDIPFRDLDVGDWWLDRFNLLLTDRAFRLDEVFGLAFVNSLQSPRETLSNVQVADLRLTGKNPLYVHAAIVGLALLWGLSLPWLIRRYILILNGQVKKSVDRDRPLMAYQKLTVEPRAGKKKNEVISFLASHYDDPALDLEMVTTALAINRNKTNELLKSEVGLTFSAYLNKLRLTEAARLLLEDKDVNVAQVAYAVGYSNVTYFNKLFKTEYGCTPKHFRTLHQSPIQTDKEGFFQT